MDEGAEPPGPGVLREKAGHKEKVEVIAWTAPIEVRIWLPDGTTLRLRAFLRELTIERPVTTIEVDWGSSKQYIQPPEDRFYTITAEGPGWKKDRHGKPVID